MRFNITHSAQERTLCLSDNFMGFLSVMYSILLNKNVAYF